MELQKLSGNWIFRDCSDDHWLPAQVPGSVHLDLLRQGLIPDPFLSDNEEKVQWVIQKDWEYQSRFDVNSSVRQTQKQFLVFDGIDTLASVKLNGTLLGEVNNMFRTYEWDVTHLLKKSDNELVLSFPSVGQYIQSKLQERTVKGVGFQGIQGGYYMRKAPCHFGWDWGPALPPIGIWKEVRLEGRTDAHLTDSFIRQHHHGNTVDLNALLTVEGWSDAPLSAVFELTAPDGEQQKTTALFRDGQCHLQISVASPQLWYPNGYGEQPLYKASLKLQTAQTTLEEKTYSLGLRTLELSQKPDEWGKSFSFIVNGIPVFAKGSNWIPADSFPTRLTYERLEKWIADTAAAHQNMLRVWGGGFYETDDFYHLCDKYGILVWQDCIFACKIYPLHQDDFVENIRHEIVDNTKRIRHHASLALWCGNNEMEWGWEDWHWNCVENSDLKSGYDTFFHYLLPRWLKELDPDTTYWPSSPSSDTPFFNVNGQAQGDAHYWDVWHKGAPFTAYRDQYPRFMSEFGFQAFPPIETINQYTNQEDHNLTSYVMELHQKNDNGNRFIINQLSASYRIPTSFEKLMYMSMVLQAEGIRYGVEHWRRNKHRVSGTLYWQLNDCWPVASWASIDYYGRWKALHYAARKFYAPILLSLFDVDNHIGIHLTSDLTHDWSGEIRWRLESIHGEVKAHGTRAVSIQSLQSAEVETVDFQITPPEKRNLVFVCELWQGEKYVSTQIATFAPNKHLNFVDPKLNLDLSETEDHFTIKVHANSLARYVELKLNGVDVVFSDNYFDVPAGQTRFITCPRPEGWSLKDAQEAISVMHLHQSFSD